MSHDSPTSLLVLFTATLAFFLSLAHSSSATSPRLCNSHADCPPTDHCLFSHCSALLPLPLLRKSPVLSPVSQLWSLAPPLSLSDRLVLLNATAFAFERWNVFRPLYYRNPRSVDPAAKLRRLYRNTKLVKSMSVQELHTRIRTAFMSGNDYHAIYIPPNPLRSTVASLNFTIALAFDPVTRKPLFVVSESRITAIRRGDVVVSIDGRRTRAVASSLGRKSYAATNDAALRRGTVSLTLRSLALDVIPTKPFATVRTRRADTMLISKTRIPWTFSRNTDPILSGVLSRLSGPATPSVGQVRPPSPPGVSINPITVNKPFDSLFGAFVISFDNNTIPTPPIGLLRLPSFFSRATPELVAELSRVVRLMPPSGLVVDIRGNTGGLPDYPKSLTELFSDVDIPPMRFQMRPTLSNLRILSAKSPFAEVQRFANVTRPVIAATRRRNKRTKFTPKFGNLFTLGLEKGRPKETRVYFGPVISVMDAASFSSGDIYAAIQKDINASLLVGVDARSAGGGANTVGYQEMARNFPAAFDGQPKALPGDASFTMPTLAFFRIGEQNKGKRVQKVGVTPHFRYFQTPTDVIANDADFVVFLLRRFAESPAWKQLYFS